MFIRQVKRKCNVRGCKNTDCFAIARSREVGNTIIICKSCLEEGLGAIDEIDPETKSNIPAIDNTPAPSLFFNAEALGVANAETTNAPPTDAANLVCPACGKVCASELGLQSHLRACKKKAGENK